jgi:ubiquinone/menaquinone biosynthesis C-methylase UbiE
MTGWWERSVFPGLMEAACSLGGVQRLRAQALAPACGRVLEIGFGTGLNLSFYPRAVEAIVAVDANAGMSARARRAIAASGFSVDHQVLDGARLPFGAESFDTVVSTFTLCSIREVTAALAEVRRVLRPEGRLLILEHGLSPRLEVQRWQRRLTPIQKRVAGGCHLDRDVEVLVREAGFGLEGWQRLELAGVPATIGSIVFGAAAPK